MWKEKQDGRRSDDVDTESNGSSTEPMRHEPGQDVSAFAGKKRQPKSLHSSPWADLEIRLQKRLGTKVTIHPYKQGGKIVIHYFSPDELDGIVDTLLS